MQANLKSASFRIGGMTCINCRDRIERKLKNTGGVEEVSVDFNTGLAAVTYNASVLTMDGIKSAIEQMDYRILNDTEKAVSVSGIIGTLVIILSLYMLARGLGIGALTSAFPLAEAGMGYGMLFVIGLVTSVHCAAMCGGINLSQCIPAVSSAPGIALQTVPQTTPQIARQTADGPDAAARRTLLYPAVFYNAGRVISYTAVGIIVGALGSAVSVSGRFQGLVQLAAGVFMVLMGINMLGLFPVLRRFNLHMPAKLHKSLAALFGGKDGGQKSAGKNPLFVGLLNGLMPCGPLQAMQLYALSTGSPVAGGISMFLFSMGTVPLMFGLGALGSVLSSRAGGAALRRRIIRAGAILVTVMGMTMFSYGFGLSGFNFDFAGRALAAVNPFGSEKAETAFTPFIENGVQIINSTLSPGRYPAITVQAGVPVRWTINAPQGSINGCNNRIIIREYGVEHRFRPGENVIEFFPEKTGRFSYSCWMGMIRSSITVVEEGQSVTDAGEPGMAPSPAGVNIPADHAALAELREGGGYQTVTITLRDDGIEPAIIVLQRGIPAAWLINNDSPDPGNSRLVFPAYYTQIDIERGDNVIQLMPEEDFDFSTADNVFYGYVKVVDDLGAVDLEAVKAEVAEYETLIYPDAYFEQAAGNCCAR
ncbi:MAG: sulfite exporter TauE/SafE family protein [Treponema sp.]|jgi:sulfite exporter TauE/SafE/copper chaperone CopZ/plastocyanin domain-containing protein|nr:sulfite exporter TauE/SafE family protein [Treponema sp.]